MSTYEKKTWVNNETKVNATNMNHIEEGIYTNSVEIEELKNDKQDVLIPGANIIIEGNIISGVATNYPVLPAEEGGTSESIVTTGEKFFWNNKQDALTFDIMPTLGSNNPVTSNGIRTYIDQWLEQKADKNGSERESFSASTFTASVAFKIEVGYSNLKIDYNNITHKKGRFGQDHTFYWPNKNGTLAVLDDIPTVPTKTSDLTNDSGYLVLSDLDDFALKSWVQDQHYLSNVSWDIITGKPTFASVATSGNYNDLINKPNIPTKTSDLTNDSNFVSDASYVHTDNNFTNSYKTQIEANTAKVSNVKADWNANSGEAQILNKPNLAQVATSGDYDDLSNKIISGEGLEFVNHNEIKIDRTVNRRYKISPDDVTQEDTIFYFGGNAAIAIGSMDGTIELDGSEFAEAFPSLHLQSNAIYRFIPAGSSTSENNYLYCSYLFVSSYTTITNTLHFQASFNPSTGEIGDFELSLSDIANFTFIPTDLKADDSNPSILILYNAAEPCQVGDGILTSSINGDPIIGDEPKNLNFVKNADNELEKVTWGQEEFKVNAPYVVQQNDVVSVVDPSHSGSSMYTATVTFSERLGAIIKEGKREIIFPSNLANQILGTNSGRKFKFTPLSNTGVYQDTPWDFLQDVGYSSTMMDAYLIAGKQEFTIFFEFHDHYQEEQEVLPSKLSSNVGVTLSESKTFIYKDGFFESFNVSIQNLRELYYNGICSINLNRTFYVYGELRTKLTIGEESNSSYDIIFSPAGLDIGYLTTSIIPLTGTYYSYSEGAVIDQFTFSTEIQVYARLLNKVVNGSQKTFVEILRIDNPSFTLVLKDFLRYDSSGNVAGWDSIDSSANMEFTFSSDKMHLLIKSARSVISEHFPTINAPTTFLEVIDCLNALFDPSQGYASHTSPIIPLILCQLIILADTVKEVKFENGSEVLMFKYDVQVAVNLSQKIMGLICWSAFASQTGGDTLIENRTDDVYYVLSGHWA